MTAILKSKTSSARNERGRSVDFRRSSRLTCKKKEAAIRRAAGTNQEYSGKRSGSKAAPALNMLRLTSSIPTLRSQTVWVVGLSWRTFKIRSGANQAVRQNARFMAIPNQTARLYHFK